MTRIHGRKAEHIFEECPVSLGIFAVYDRRVQRKSCLSILSEPAHPRIQCVHAIQRNSAIGFSITAFEGGQQLSPECAIDNAVVAGKRYGHEGRESDAAIRSFNGPALAAPTASIVD